MIKIDEKFLVVSSFSVLFVTGIAVIAIVIGLLKVLEDANVLPQIKYYYIDKTGKKVLDGTGFYGDSFKEGLALVCDKYDRRGGMTKFRYIDHSGKTKFSVEAYQARSFSEGLAAIDTKIPNVDGGCAGYMDKDGAWVIKPAYHGFGEPFSDGLALTTTPKFDLQFIDHEGNSQVKVSRYTQSHFWRENLEPFSDGLARITIGDLGHYDPKSPPKYGYMNKQGVLQIKPTELRCSTFHDGLARRDWVKDGQLLGSTFIDAHGKEVLNIPYKVAGDFSEGLCAVRGKTNYGYCDQSGKIVIKPQFGEAREFSEELAAVTIKGRVGYINRQGGLVIPPQFAYAGDFSEGLAVVVPFVTHENALVRPDLYLWGEPSGKDFQKRAAPWKYFESSVLSD